MTTERELISMLETNKKFINILLGKEIVVHTYHKNLTYKIFNTKHIMWFPLVIKEFGPELKDIKGEKNVISDALSRLEFTSNTTKPNISEFFEYYDEDLSYGS